MDKTTLVEEDALFVRDICIRSFQRNIDLANDCFLYVWEKLHEDDSRRLRAFKGESRFRTFLYSVTNKLIIDFRRTQFGYKVLPKFFWDFDDINRRVFKLFFYHNSTHDSVENAIRAEFRISPEDAQRRVDDVEKRIRESRVRLETTKEKEHILLGDDVGALASDYRAANPEENIISAETDEKRNKILKLLKEEVQKFEAEDALILQLYFEHDLSAKEISHAIPGVKDKAVYKRIEKMLKNLKKELKENGITEEDIKEIFERL
ncbi:MAG TPA: sigma-70 family RNA polymerase sigma factor [Thermodesulfobacteriota bacterium]